MLQQGPINPLHPQVAAAVLQLLSEWGWHAGMERLQQACERETDPLRRGSLQLLTGWIAGERGLFEKAQEAFAQAEHLPALTRWALVGQAFVALAAGHYDTVEELLGRIDADDKRDPMLSAAVAHCWGACWYHRGQNDRALSELFRALELFGSEHLGTGRVLDTLGMVYASRHVFALARDFYQKALDLKGHFSDKAGLAVTYGQLGRLYLEWGDPGRAEDCFQKDLQLALGLKDQRGAALMYNHLGRVALERGRGQEALTYLDESVARNQAGGWAVGEAFARKDRALAYLLRDDLARAAEDIRRAEELFPFPAGKMHAQRAHALYLQAQGEHAAATELLRDLANRFHDIGETAEAARTQLELVRAQRRLKVDDLLVIHELKQGLAWAETAQRDHLIRRFEQELQEVAPVEHLRWLYRRVRGRDIHEDTASLREGTGEEASVLFLDLRESTLYQHSEDAAIVLTTINQIFSAMVETLRKQRIIVNQYLGDGFMALVRGAGHPVRVVRAALDLFPVVEQFNRPRRVLGLRLFEIRIGISTGYVCFGNVGTYEKIDFTAVGRTTNLAARLQKYSTDGKPCASEETYRRTRDEFAWEGPLSIKPDGFAEQQVWLASELRR